MISLIFGLALGAAVWAYVRSVERIREGRETLVDVLAAADEIPPGTRLRPGLFKVNRIPRAYAQPSLVPAGELLDDKGSPLYENLLPIVAGEQLVASRLCAIGSSGGFSWLIPEGRVAMSVELLPERCAGGLLHPGDTVDVFATLPADETGRPLSVTLVLLENVRVLGVDGRLIGGRVLEKSAKPAEAGFLPDSGERPVSLALLLRPFEAAALAHARETGSVRLAVRAAGDDHLSELRPLDGRVLAGGGGPVPARAEGAGAAPAAEMEKLMKGLKDSLGDGWPAR